MAGTVPEGVGHQVTRRNFLRSASVAGLGASGLLGLAPAGAAAPEAASARLEAIPFKESLTRMSGISERTVREHWKLYEGYVNKTNEIRAALASLQDPGPNPTYSPLRELKVEYTFALNGAKNHALYFEHLGGRGGQPSGALLTAIERNFGSFDRWQQDLTQTALAARGWAWLVYDRDTGRLENILGDTQNTYLVWNAVPLVALDVYEHAYWLDHQTNRRAYLQAFFANLDWAVVQARVERLRIL